jgi:hypothetical protein
MKAASSSGINSALAKINAAAIANSISTVNGSRSARRRRSRRRSEEVGRFRPPAGYGDLAPGLWTAACDGGGDNGGGMFAFTPARLAVSTV